LENVEWGEYKLGDLFKIENTLSFNKDKLVEGIEFDYVTRTSQNQGILQKTGFVNKENINEPNVWSLGLLQMDFFYRDKYWYAGQFVRKIIPKIQIKESTTEFFTVVLNKLKNKLLLKLVRNVDETFLNETIKLPKKDGEIDFDFIENFIKELKNERIAKLDDYLKVSGLNSYVLTEDENLILRKFEKDKVEFSDFKLDILFDKIKTKKIHSKSSELPKKMDNINKIPCLTSSFKNQGLNCFISEKEVTVLRNVISLPSNSDIYRSYFQSKDFTILSDAYAINWSYGNIELTHSQYLFIVPCINKVTDLSIYSYKNKLGGWNVVKDKFIKLPIKNNKPDYKTMELLVSALKKTFIKNVVLYSNDIKK